MVGDEILTNAEYAEADTSDLTSGVVAASIIASPISLMSSDYCWLYAWNGSNAFTDLEYVHFYQYEVDEPSPLSTTHRPHHPTTCHPPLTTHYPPPTPPGMRT